ncbi:MAG: hypothetical protein MJ198_05290 [Bacteroidales bacterium]|nr:hypothetical protein [Bacteroidales bacterium]
METIILGKTLRTQPFTTALLLTVIFSTKKKFTDPVIIEKNTDKHFINVPQAYTRCNLIEIKNNVFITSDKGIYQELTKNNCECLYVNPQGIQLPPYKYGFIGGCMGKCDDTIYINGSLSKHSNGSTIKKFISKYNLNIIELHDGELYDGGGIFFFSA